MENQEGWGKKEAASKLLIGIAITYVIEHQTCLWLAPKNKTKQKTHKKQNNNKKPKQKKQTNESVLLSGRKWHAWSRAQEWVGNGTRIV